MLRRNLILVLTPLVLAGVVIVGVKSMATVAGSAAPTPSAQPTSSLAATTTSPPPATTTPQPTSDDPIGAGAATDAVHAADETAASGEKLSVAVLDRVTGKETDGADASTTVPCASVLKLFLITDLFHQQEQGTITLSKTDLAEIASALTISNDAAMNTLWGKYHGQAAISQLIDIAHLPDAQITSIVATGMWGGVMISARDVLAVYEYLLTKLSPDDRDLIVGDLNHANPVGYQGFNQAFGLLNPATRTGTTKAKQGWSNWFGQTVLNTTGILDDHDKLVVAVLTSRPGHGTPAQYDTARGQIDDATDALLKALGPNATR